MNEAQNIAPASKDTCCPVPIVIPGLVRDWGIQWTALL